MADRIITTVRDQWEAQRARYEDELSLVLGTAWTIQVDPKALYAYADSANNKLLRESPGKAIKRYEASMLRQESDGRANDQVDT